MGDHPPRAVTKSALLTGAPETDRCRPVEQFLTVPLGSALQVDWPLQVPCLDSRVRQGQGALGE